MHIFELLKANKGTVSSALGKELGAKALAGDCSIIDEASKYVCFELDNPHAKNIRAGAAKILEVVAEKNPELISPILEKIKPSLGVTEPQTRWMIISVFGQCAKLDPEMSKSVMCHAKEFLTEDAGVCLSGAVFRYLGKVGATSQSVALEVLPLLDDSMRSASENEIDWILEGFLSIISTLDRESLIIIKKNAELCLDAKKKSTQDRARKIIRKIGQSS